jgi:multidrug efflux system outer membrane protein
MPRHDRPAGPPRVRFRRLLPAVGAAFLLAGCQVGPSFHAPHPELPARFTAAGGGAPIWPARGFWREYDSPQLTALVDAARTRGFSVREAVAQLEIANAEVEGAAAPLFPTVGLGGSGSFTQTGGTRDTHQYAANLQASYEIDFWGKTRDALAAARANAAAARFNAATVALTAESAVATTYLQALADADLLRIARRNLAAARGLLTQLRAEFAAGVADAPTVAQQAALVAAEAATIPNLQSLYRQQIIALGTLTGQAPEFMHVAGGTLAALRVPRLRPGLPSALLARRPDVAEARAVLIGANANIRAAIAAFFPSISLTGSAGWQSAALNALFVPGSSLLSAAASLSAPLFEGGARRSALRVSRATWREDVAAYEAAVVQAFSDTETALTALHYATRQEALAARAVARARIALTAAEAQLRVGVVDIGTVLTAEQTLLSDENTLVNARLARLQASVALYKALGGGWTAAAMGER